MTEGSAGNRRADQRLRAIRTGKIALNGGTSVVDCLIRDISRSGARLGVDETAMVPDRFEMIVLLADGNRLERCRVVWRRPTEIGVIFE